MRRWLSPLVRFLQIEAASGIVLLACTALALWLANSEWAGLYRSVWETPVNLHIGAFELLHPPHDNLLGVINDGLMTIFFFVVGLEIKREIIGGELSEWRKAALPVVAALGGMLVPAGIYFAQQSSGPAARGWGIPMATDIAFVVGVLALLGRRAPFGLRIFLLSLAIADDIGAVLVIAVAYTDHLRTDLLLWGAGGFALTYLFNLIGVRRVPIYVVLGVGIWCSFLAAGVHPTVAGVLLGLMTPASAWIGDASLTEILGDALRRYQDDTPGASQARHSAMSELAFTAREAVSPLERLEIALHPWVSFVIMPLFALANAGVAINMGRLADPIALAVATGLFFGKPIGIVLFSWLAVRLGIARLPAGVDWKAMLGAGCLGGIGFTMSLFVAALALPPELLDAGKIGTMTGSVLSAILGTTILLIVLPRVAQR